MTVPEQISYPAITGIGGAVGGVSLPNDALIAKYNLNSDDEAIRTRTGIEHRYHVHEGVLPSSLGMTAARIALETAGIDAANIEEIIVATSSPDQLLPNTASKIHGGHRLPRTAGASDIGAACSGALYALESASAKMIAFGQGPSLIVGTEILSAGINPNDRRTAILFGDGAGAMVLQSVMGAHRPAFATLTEPDEEAINVKFGIRDLAGFSSGGDRHFIAMDGQRVLGHALEMLPAVALLAAERAGISDGHSIDTDSIDLFVPHQANLRMIDPLADYLGIPDEKRVRTVVKHGNTSSASIPLGLYDAYINGRLSPDRLNRVLMVAIGAGMVAKAAVLDVQIGATQLP